MNRHATLQYSLPELLPYINWLYFFHAWGFGPKWAETARVAADPAARRAWLGRQPAAEVEQAQACLQLYDEAISMLNALSDPPAEFGTIGRCILFDVRTDGDDICCQTDCGEVRLPCLRQQAHGSGPDGTYLSLADYLNPNGDTLGVFATSVDAKIETLYAGDPYRHMLVQLLCDRLAEATAEKMHQYVRTTLWGYAPHETLPPEALFAEQYQGIRPAVGYPSLPDQSINFVIDRLIGLHELGITLTETGAMRPHASVSGLMIAHPQASYFSIGPIGLDQLADYARRRNMPVATLRKFLNKNLM